MTSKYCHHFSWTTLIFLSTVVGYFGTSDAEVGGQRSNFPNHHPSPNSRHFHGHARISKIQDSLPHHLHQPPNSILSQQAQDSHIRNPNLLTSNFNETLWTEVLEATYAEPFNWIKLSKALDALEQNYQRLHYGSVEGKEVRASKSPEFSEGVRNHTHKRWKFTYHRVFTLLRNPRGPSKLSAIAAVSASEVRPLSSSIFSTMIPPSSSSLIVSTIPTMTEDGSKSSRNQVSKTVQNSQFLSPTLSTGSDDDDDDDDDQILSKLFPPTPDEFYDDDDDEKKVKEDHTGKVFLRHFYPKKLSGHSTKEYKRRHPYFLGRRHHDILGHDDMESLEDKNEDDEECDNGYSHHHHHHHHSHFKRHDPMK